MNSAYKKHRKATYIFIKYFTFGNGVGTYMSQSIHILFSKDKIARKEPSYLVYISYPYRTLTRAIQ